MRVIVVLILHTMAFAASGQPLGEVERRLNLVPLEVLYDTAGFSALPALAHGCHGEDGPMWDHYHVMDLNNDGLMDLLYSGPCNPYLQTIIYLNRGDTMVEVENHAGRVVSIDRNNEGAIIDVFKEACCCDRFSDMWQISISKDRTSSNHIQFGAGMHFDVNDPAQVSVGGVLRSTPSLDDTKRKDECTDEMITGNQLAVIPAGTNVVQLNKYGEWRLVLYALDHEVSLIGWIKG